jgi:hypothetical protein
LLVAGDVGATKAILREGIREIPVYDRMLQFLKERKGEPISLTSLTSAFATESGLTGTTPRRRLTTMLGWFQELGFIEREGNDVYFKRSP